MISHRQADFQEFMKKKRKEQVETFASFIYDKESQNLRLTAFGCPEPLEASFHKVMKDYKIEPSHFTFTRDPENLVQLMAKGLERYNWGPWKIFKTEDAKEKHFRVDFR